MTFGISIARRDSLLVGLGFLVGAWALPWLPGRHLPDSSITALGLALLVPGTALSLCVGRSVFVSRARTEDERSRASAAAVATATTTLCSFALCLQILLLTTLVGVSFTAPAPARVAVVLFGMHLAALGNALPRLRPGWPAGATAPQPGDQAWMRVRRVVGYVCVAGGLTITVAGATLGGNQIDRVFKTGLAGAAVWVAWSLHRVRTA